MHILPNLTQKFEHIELEDSKRATAVELLSLLPGSRTIILVSPTNATEHIGPAYMFLRAFGLNAEDIDQDLPEPEREEVLQSFNSGEFPILVATHSSLRGLAVSQGTRVIVSDIPSSIDEYVECLRYADTGEAFIYFDHSSLGMARELIQVLKDNKQDVPEWLEGASSGQ